MTLVDEARLAGWLDGNGLAPGQPLSVQPLAGGASNAMYLLERGGQRWVLRRPPGVAQARADEGMRREFHILTALEGTPVPHPAPVALCEDRSVLGRTFFLMQHLEGQSALPAPPALDDAEGRVQITDALADGLAALHEVDWQAAGLGDLGRPGGFHERQVERWTRQLASYEGRELPGIDGVAQWLSASLPISFRPALMHGDYHMNNVLISPERPGRLVAILDWETATIGDPLLDLAGFCEIWTSFAGEGWPGREAVVARYATARGLTDVGDLGYYSALYSFRMAVLLEGVYQRSLRDPSRPPQDAVGEQALVFLSRASELTC